jgi:hypothetical protein
MNFCSSAIPSGIQNKTRSIELSVKDQEENNHTDYHYKDQLIGFKFPHREYDSDWINMAPYPVQRQSAAHEPQALHIFLQSYRKYESLMY